MSEPKNHTTTIAPTVLLTIARLSALSVEGVLSLAPVQGGVNRLFKRGVTDGVQIELREDSIWANVFLIVRGGKNIREIGRNVQREVHRAMQDIAGLKVENVNIYIEDVEYPTPA
ncbi:MAG TPA: Asp23/Gls24 family envelope stress response protein [Anaerolineales bacterium]|nr:Asp23/Gls24 family envelope stress response protein [Anaerolineales bacterium]